MVSLLDSVTFARVALRIRNDALQTASRREAVAHANRGQLLAHHGVAHCGHEGEVYSDWLCELFGLGRILAATFWPIALFHMVMI